MHWIYLIHEFHILSWITEINELFHHILIWDAPVYGLATTPQMMPDVKTSFWCQAELSDASIVLSKTKLNQHWFGLNGLLPIHCQANCPPHSAMYLCVFERLDTDCELSWAYLILIYSNVFICICWVYEEIKRHLFWLCLVCSGTVLTKCITLRVSFRLVIPYHGQILSSP